MRLSATLFACLLATSAMAAPLPIEQFFQAPAMSGASISPDGRYLALRQTSPAGRSMLVVQNAATGAQLPVASFGNADVAGFYWLNDTRLAYSLINVDGGGSVSQPGLYAVERDGKGFAALEPAPAAAVGFAGGGLGNDYLAQASLHGYPLRQDDKLPLPAGARQWLRDAGGQLRVATLQRDGKQVVLLRDGNDWRQLAAFAPDAPEAFTPVLYSDNTLYVRAYRGKNEAAIYRYDIDKNTLSDKPMITVPEYDADGYYVLGEQTLRGYRVNTDSETTVWFDAAMKTLQQEVDQLMPGTVNTLSVGAHSATPYALVDAHREIQPHLYYLYNRDTKKLQRLGAARPQLDPDQMAPSALVRFAARDGLQIPVYATVPEGEGKRPTVVLVGATPEQRNGSWEWSPEVQFLASRGYVVLQPNPRGTQGFGAALRNAGDGQWGRAVQEDIVDTVKWAVKRGYTDPARVCIAGTGYGGYAALVGLQRDQYGFRCGISWSGLTHFGEVKIDTAAIGQPVLLAYGKQDTLASFGDGVQLRDALRAGGNQQVEWLEYQAGAEDRKTQANRIDLWRHIEAFLAKSLAK